MSEGNFRVYATSGQAGDPTFYFVESTAPDNVELRETSAPAPQGLTLVDDPDTAIEDIAALLVPDDRPDIDANLVVMVHGYNNPRDSVLDFYAKALDGLEANKAAVFGDDNRRVVCIGFRWPSEKIFSVFGSSLSALPSLPRILLLAAAFACLGVFGACWMQFDAHWAQTGVLAAALLIFGLVGFAALLRAIVYFRDVYRATNYGVPDLVELIRHIDAAAAQRAKASGDPTKRRRIALSFIGHSMGGLVVTNAIRVLTDVFDPQTLQTRFSGAPVGSNKEAAAAPPEHVTGRIGHVFTLMRFVLASPDIPAEALLADRANFLAASLRRFREAYLFSSEGDDVLRLISTTANYFSFPTVSRNFGYRLGNTEILSEGFGGITPHHLLTALRVGRTHDLKALAQATRRQEGDAASVAEAFSFFDCTDYVDGSPPRGLLTAARNYKAHDKNGAIPFHEHCQLLLRYFLPGRAYIDLHGGYFEGETTQRLITLLACVGFQSTVADFGGEQAMLAHCRQKQIRVLLSERLKRHALTADRREQMSDRREQMR